MTDRLSLVKSPSGQEMEYVYSYNPGAHTRHLHNYYHYICQWLT